MSGKYAVVDLFAGPGGLAEGFSAVTDELGNKPFRIALSVEMEPTAHATLRLRSFLRQFSNGYPDEYYAFLNNGTPEPDWPSLFPDEWAAAEREALNLTLGKAEDDAVLDTRLDELRAEHGDWLIVIGGPPCQAYSLVGRARNKGVAGYTAEGDPKHRLYEQYVRILGKLRPAAFVMENVKGMLSSSLDGGKVFDMILADLKDAAGEASYRLVALAPGDNGELPLEPRPSQFIVRAENHGVPQARHRVIIVGVRADMQLAGSQAQSVGGILQKVAGRATVAHVLDGMPKLRSGLSKEADSFHEWYGVLSQAVSALKGSVGELRGEARTKYADHLSTFLTHPESKLPRSANTPNGMGADCDPALKTWLLDKKLNVLPNNETRGHMASDLTRYLFAALYAEVFSVSPKATDFPQSLAPEHKNWKSGKFADRFRVQLAGQPSTTVTSHISKDGHYFIHPDPAQCRSLTVREAARLQTFPDNYLFKGNRTQQFVQVGNAVPPFLARKIGDGLWNILKPDGDADSLASR
jgi:DNA (cytosine-5)-methyltransferase 1